MEKRVKREKREKEYISIAEASEILGVSYNHVRDTVIPQRSALQGGQTDSDPRGGVQEVPEEPGARAARLLIAMNRTDKEVWREKKWKSS